MKKALTKVFNSELYIFFIYFLACICWLAKIDYRIYLPIITLIVVIYSLTQITSKGLIPIFTSLIVANIFHLPSDGNDVNNVLDSIDYNFIVIIAVINIIALLYFYIKNRRTCERVSYIGISMIAVFASFALTDIFVQRSINFLIVGLLILLFYFIRHTIDYYRMKESFLPYFSRSMFYLGMTIAFQIVVYYAINFTLDSPVSFAPSLGWGNSNSASIMLLLIIPIASYTLFYTQNPGYFVGLLILFTANLLTTSRGGILGMGILLILMALNNYRKYHSRQQFFKGLLITLIYFLILFLGFTPYFMKILKMLFYDGISDSGRFDLWREAIELFKLHPLLGSGSVLFPMEGLLRQHWFHSTIFDVLGQLGIVGCLTFIFHFVVKYFVTFTERSTYKWFVLSGFVASGFYALLDVAYFNFTYLFIYVIILATIEYSSGYLSYQRND